MFQDKIYNHKSPRQPTKQPFKNILILPLYFLLYFLLIIRNYSDSRAGKELSENILINPLMKVKALLKQSNSSQVSYGNTQLPLYTKTFPTKNYQNASKNIIEKAHILACQHPNTVIYNINEKFGKKLQYLCLPPELSRNLSSCM